MFPALITALFLGLRHGSDIDHVAAISNLSATEGGGLRAARPQLLPNMRLTR